MVALVPPEVLRRSPSIEDGIDAATEEALRNFGGELIQRGGVLLKLPQVTVASAAAVFQRFYFHRSFADFEVRAVAAASVALASKLEEHVRKLRDVIIVFHRLQMRELEDDGAPEFSGRPTPGLEVGGKEYEDLKKEVLRAERHVLRELGFEVALFLDLPHRYILRYVGALTKEGPSDLAQRAWNYLNDASRTPLCCSHQPDVIAAAGVFLAARAVGLKLPSSPPWSEAVGVSMREMRDVARTILELYRRPRARHIAIPRKKKPRPEAAPEAAAAPFPETPAPPMGSPDSDAGPEDAGDPGDAPGGPADPPGANGHEDRAIDAARVAELVAEQGETDAGPPAAKTSRDGVHLSVQAEEVKRHTRRDTDLEKFKDVIRDREAAKERNKEAEQEREPEKDKERHKGRDKERDREKGQERDQDRKRGRKKDKELDKQREKEREKDRVKERGRDKQRKGRDKRAVSSDESSSSSPVKGRRKAPAAKTKGKEKKPRREASSSSASASSRSRKRRRPNPRKHGVDEEDL